MLVDRIQAGEQLAMALDYPEVNAGGKQGRTSVVLCCVLKITIGHETTLRVLLCIGDKFNVNKAIEVRYALGFKREKTVDGQKYTITVTAQGSQLALTVQEADKVIVVLCCVVLCCVVNMC